jgi:hypothetical protein
MSVPQPISPPPPGFDHLARGMIVGIRSHAASVADWIYGCGLLRPRSQRPRLAAPPSIVMK